MRLDRAGAPAGPQVQAFVGHGFRIDGIVYENGALLTPSTASAWDAPALAALTAAMLAPLTDLSPEFILLGTGAGLRRPDPLLIASLEAMGIGVEVMDSRAAARAWGVLRAEDRKIGAALLPLDAA